MADREEPPGNDPQSAGASPEEAPVPRRAGRPRGSGSGQPSRKRQIRDAAITVFANKGYHAARVSDIANEAGVAHGLVYHYFSSKDEVLEHIFRRTWLQLEQGITAIADGDQPAAEQLAGIVRIMLGSYRLAPDLVRVVILEVTRSGHLRAQVDEITQVFRLIESIIATGQRAGEFREDIDPKLVSYVFWGAIDEVMTGWIFGTLPSDDEDVRAAEHALMELVLNGLRLH